MLGHVAWLALLCVALGVVGGVVWEAVWRPPLAVVVEGRTVLAGAEAERAFDATGWFLIVGGAGGLLAGVLTGALVRVRQLLTLVVLLAGSALAGVVMAAVGAALGPPDPARIASRSQDLTRLPMALEVSSLPAYLVFPIGAVTGLLLVLVLAPADRGGVGAPADRDGTLPT